MGDVKGEGKGEGGNGEREKDSKDGGGRGCINILKVLTRGFLTWVTNSAISAPHWVTQLQQ